MKCNLIQGGSLVCLGPVLAGEIAFGHILNGDTGCVLETEPFNGFLELVVTIAKIVALGLNLLRFWTSTQLEWGQLQLLQFLRFRDLLPFAVAVNRDLFKPCNWLLLGDLVTRRGVFFAQVLWTH